jgi:hypothetical protein
MTRFIAACVACDFLSVCGTRAVARERTLLFGVP